MDRRTSNLAHVALSLGFALFVASCALFESESPEHPDAGAPTEDAGCVAGRQDCVCAPGGACLGSLECSDDGLCLPPATCTSGATGCACLDDEVCLSSSDACDEGVCEPIEVCERALGCPCGVGNACDDGLICDDALCRIGNGLTLAFSGGDARACDLSITTRGRSFGDVVYAAGFRGQARHRGDRIAIALVRTVDSALEGAAATLVFGDAAPSHPADVREIVATCYDRLGDETDLVTVRVE